MQSHRGQFLTYFGGHLHNERNNVLNELMWRMEWLQSLIERLGIILPPQTSLPLPPRLSRTTLAVCRIVNAESC